MKKYYESGDIASLNTFKEYCKNDVRMTAMVLLYLLHYQEFVMDDILCVFDEMMMTEDYRTQQSSSIQSEELY
jgi:predicted RNA-binding protein with PIN domain